MSICLMMVEILSPSSIIYDRRTKFDVYENAGIPEFWIINPKSKSVEIYQLKNESYGWSGEFSEEEKLISPLLGELNFQAADLFIQ